MNEQLQDSNCHIANFNHEHGRLSKYIAKVAWVIFEANSHDRFNIVRYSLKVQMSRIIKVQFNVVYFNVISSIVLCKIKELAK